VQLHAGKRKGKSCVAARGKIAKSKRCTYDTSVHADLARTVTAGNNTITFTGRVGKVVLGVGSYRAILLDQTPIGSKAAPRVASFKVVAVPRKK
jgi:hypothetical protein